MNGTQAYALSKKYTDGSISGITGTLAGKNCKIKSVVKSGEQNTVTFEWTADDGTVNTSTMTVDDGAEISSASVDSNNHLILTMSDGNTVDAGEMPKEDVRISAESGNALAMKTDGLYVSATGVEISAETGNQLKTKADGLFVPETDISGKVDKVAGKGLSTEDYTTAEKTAVATISDKVDKVTGKGLSTNDYDATEKAEVAKVKDKLDANKVVSSFSATTSDSNVASEKLVKDSLDGKADKTEVDYAYENGFVSSNIVELGGGSESAIGVSVVTNTDGSITFSGTATSGGTFYIVDKVCKGSTFAKADKFNLASGGYAMIDGSLTNANAVVKLSSADNNKILSNTPLKLESGEYAFAVIVSAGAVNGTIKPMISELPISSYEPYAKSNVELTHATNDDLKMLGWTVPSECPIQNYTDQKGIFHQRVGRVDLGSLAWLYKTDPTTTAFSAGNFSPAKGSGNVYCLEFEKKTLNYYLSPGKYINIETDIYGTDADTIKANLRGIYLYYELATEVTKSVDGNEATREKTLQTIACSVEPTEKSTIYEFQDDRLKNANMVIACFYKLGNCGIVCYETNTWHSLTSYDPDDSYWSSTLQARFNRSEGKLSFRVLYKGSSQTFENCKLTSVCYYN